MIAKFNSKNIVLNMFFLFTFYVVKGGVPFEKVAHNLETLETFNKLNNSSHYNLLKIQGKVEKICIYSNYDVVEKFGEILDDQSKVKKGCLEFNINGKVMKITKEDKVTREYLYDSGGKLIEVVEKNQKTQENNKFYYNENNLLVKQDHFYGDNLRERFIYKYDNNNKPIELSCYDSNGDLNYYEKNRYFNNVLVEMEENWFQKSVSTSSKVTIYKYNLAGLKSEVEITKNSNNLNQDLKEYNHSVNKLSYDLKGNVISGTYIVNNKTIWNSFNSSPCSYNEFQSKDGYHYKKDQNDKCVQLRESESIYNVKYDLNNNKIEVHTGNGRSEYYKYDEYNREVSYKDFENEVLKRSHYHTYNSQGFILSNEEEDKDDIIELKKKYEYTYDSKGNIITEKFYRNGKIERFEKNSYVYY